MLKDTDFEEAVRRFKSSHINWHERQRYHALLLVTKGYSYRETGEILLVDEETVSRWVGQYQLGGLDELKNEPNWGGNHGQRALSERELEELKKNITRDSNGGEQTGQWLDKQSGAGGNRGKIRGQV
jgi:transposase